MKWKMEKATLGFRLSYTYIKYGKIWSVSLELFIKQKSLFSEGSDSERSDPKEPAMENSKRSCYIRQLTESTAHCHQSLFIGPSINLALGLQALKHWFNWFSTELIHWGIAPSTATSYSILSSLVIQDKICKKWILSNFVRAKKLV